MLLIRIFSSPKITEATIVSSLLPYLCWRTHKESRSRTRCSSVLKICLGARSNETLQEQQRALAKRSDMQKQQTTLQEHLQMFAKDVRPGVVCLWRKAPFTPLPLGGRHPPASAAHFSSPEGGHQTFSLANAADGTEQRAGIDRHRRALYMGATKRGWDQHGVSSEPGVQRSLGWGLMFRGSFRAPCRWGGQPRETKPRGRNSLQPSRLHQPLRFEWLSQSTQTKRLCLPNNPGAFSAAQMQDGPLEAKVAM